MSTELKPTVNERIAVALGMNEPEAPKDLVRKPAEITTTGNEDQDLDADFEVARRILHRTAETLTDLSDTATYLAKEKQDAKSVEAAAIAGKAAVDSALSMIDLHQKKADVRNAGRKTVGDKITQNNAVFVGTTGEALRLTRDLALGNGIEAFHTITVEAQHDALNTSDHAKSEHAPIPK